MSSAACAEEAGQPFSGAIRALLFLALIFFLNFTSRVIFAPLLPVISKELGLDYFDSGSFFFCISIGYFISILLSGHISSRLGHRKTIALSSCLSGGMLVLLAGCSSLESLRAGLVAIGMAAGLYFPSGLATIGRLVPSGYLARGMAVHELAPNLSFVLTPLLCGGILAVMDWRRGLVCIGVLQLVVGLFYYIRGAQGTGRGIPPGISLIMRMVRLPEFWLITLMFSMAICSTLGIYALLPLYLVSEQGIGEDKANLLVSLSRISSIFMPIAGGWLADRYGTRIIMGGTLFLAGCLTVPIGFLGGMVMISCIVLQAMAAVCFFPAAFAELSSVGGQGDRGAAVSFSLPLAFLVGGGLSPALIGGIGDLSRLGYGIALAGVLMVVVSFSVLLLRKQ